MTLVPGQMSVYLSEKMMHAYNLSGLLLGDIGQDNNGPVMDRTLSGQEGMLLVHIFSMPFKHKPQVRITAWEVTGSLFFPV